MNVSKDSLRKIRYRIMDLLYAYPMTKYAADHTMNVAIIGTRNEILLEALKAVFSYGQAVYYDEDSGKCFYYGLQIRIFAPDGDAFDTYYKQRMPGLTDSFEGEYAEISCYGVGELEETLQLSEHAGGEKRKGFSQAKEKKSSCNYIIICDSASECADISISGNQIKGYSGEAGVLVAEFANDDEGFRVYGETENGIFIDKRIREELKQMNLNQKYVNILAKDNCAPYSEAVKKQINDYNKDDKYNYDSSYACTAHIPYKLAIFGTGRQETEVIGELSEILSLPDEEKRKNEIFKGLIRLEHRRWNAYMIANGFEAPTIEMFKSYAYRDENTHKLNKGGHKYHPCISEGGEDPFYLHDHREEFNNENFESSGALSDLDKFSIRCHQLLVRRAKEIENDEEKMAPLQDLKKYQNSTLRGFCKVAENYITDENYQDKFLYNKSKEAALEVTADQSQNDPLAWKTEKDDLVKQVDKLVSVFMNRNARKDYYLLDNDIINGLYFDLWHGRKYQTVITACTGMPEKDIVLPLLLSCERAIFLLNANRQSEQERIQAFFARRESVSDKDKKLIESNGGEYNLHHTECVFLNADLLNKEEILANICACFGNDIETADKIVLNYSDFVTGAVAATFGEAASENDSLALLAFDSGVVRDCKSGQNISCGIKKCMTADEHLKLSGAKIENIYDSPYVPAEFEEIRKIFKEFNETSFYEKDGKDVSYCVWSALSGDYMTGISKNTEMDSFFGKDIMNEVKDDDENDGQNANVKNLKIRQEVFNVFHLDRILEALEKSRIISNMYIDDMDDSADGLIRISFYAPDQTIRYCFRALSKWNHGVQPDQYLIEFAGYGFSKDIIRYLNTRAETLTKKGTYRQIFVDGDKPEVKAKKLKFMKELYNAGIITDTAKETKEFLRQSPFPPENLSGTMQNFRFANIHLKQMFQAPGKIFELMLYKQIASLGMFGNVKTGVRIAWGEDQTDNAQEQIVRLMAEENAIGCAAFKAARGRVLRSEDEMTFNEIDVVIMTDMHPIFISCKTGTEVKKEWLYEIASVSSYFHATPVLAVSLDMSRQRRGIQLQQGEEKTGLRAGAQRAIAMGISVFGSETIYDSKRFKECMETIARGDVYVGGQ